MAKSTYYDSPFGTGIHLHIGVADTKFNSDGLFHGKLKLSGEPAEKMKAKIDAASEAAFEDFMERGDGADLKPGDKKKFEVYRPYEVEEDDDGNPTGAILFDFKQNAKIKLRDGTTKALSIAVYDAKGKEMHKDPGDGSVLRFKYAMRPIPMKSLKQVGVRLDFCAVQVKDFQAKGRGGGFGAVEGYEDDGASEEGFGGDATSSEGSGAADY